VNIIFFLLVPSHDARLAKYQGGAGMSDGFYEVGTVEPHRISGPLMLGLLVAPVLFAWFLLRRGYATSTRIAAFSYAAVTFGFGLLRAVL
jgi:hypothetical protein